MRSLPAIMLSMCCLTGRGLVDAVFEPPEWYAGGGAVGTGTENPPISANRFRLEEGQDVVGEIQVLKADYEDTFVDIARAYGLGYDELVAANPGVDPWIPGQGTEIILPTRFVLPVAGRDGIVLNIASKRLFYFPVPENGGPRVVETYPIGIGRAGWETPTGDTAVVSKARDPIWYVPSSVRIEHAAAGDPLPKRIPPGPDNPLGKYVIGLGIPGYLIHGTNKPAGVGMRVSHGCIRLFPENIEYLFERVAIGSRVRIVNQPVLFGWQDGDLLLEAHASLAEDNRDWIASLLPRARSSLVEHSGEPAMLDEKRMRIIADDRRGFPISVFADGADMERQVRDARRVINIVAYDGIVSQNID